MEWERERLETSPFILYPITCMTKAYGKVRKDTRQYVSPVLTRIDSVINEHVEIPNVSREKFI